MMQGMDLDARRCRSLISQVELDENIDWLAAAITEAIDYFIVQAYSPQHGLKDELALAIALPP